MVLDAVQLSVCLADACAASRPNLSFAAMAADGAGVEYYFLEECPAKDTCTAQAWRKARVWGWTSDECLQKLRLHLKNCSLRHCDDDMIENMVCDAQLSTATWTPPHKKQRQEPDADLKEQVVAEVLRGLPPQPKRLPQQRTQDVSLSLAAASSTGPIGDVRIRKQQLQQATRGAPLYTMLPRGGPRGTTCAPRRGSI